MADELKGLENSIDKLIATAMTVKQERDALIEALEDVLEAIPKQTNDCAWWPDELTAAVAVARALIVAVNHG